MSASPPTEDGGADADEGAAFFDGDFVVVAHAHGEGWEGEVRAGLEGVTEVTQGDEVGARGFRVFVEGRDAHEALDVETIEAEEIIKLGQQSVG